MSVRMINEPLNLPIRVKPLEIQVITNVEKKMTFCDRDLFNLAVRDSGRQLHIELQTVLYEYFKNHGVNIMQKIGPVEMPNVPINGNDLNDANIETKFYLDLKLNNTTEYSVTYNLYYTNCSILIQNLKSQSKLDDGRFPCKPFYEDYLVPALHIIISNIDIKKETNLLKAQISKSLQNVQTQNLNCYRKGQCFFTQYPEF